VVLHLSDERLSKLLAWALKRPDLPAEFRAWLLEALCKEC
jgi:hypothetical protein